MLGPRSSSLSTGEHSSSLGIAEQVGQRGLWKYPHPTLGSEAERSHSPCTGAGFVEEGEGDGAGHLGPHFPGAAEHVDPVEEALQVLGLGLVPYRRQS